MGMDIARTEPTYAEKIMPRKTTSFRALSAQPEIKAFMDIVAKKAEESDNLVQRMAAAACEVQAAKDACEQDVQYVVKMSEDVKKAIANGDIKLARKSTGELCAQIRRPNGQYGGTFSIEEAVVAKGIDPTAAQIALQTQTIQRQLDEIVSALQEISSGISDIKQGQRDDRYGLMMGGRVLYLESTRIKDSNMRMLLEAQALKSLSDASGQLTESAKSTVRYLTERKYEQQKKGRKAIVDEKVADLRHALEAINTTFAMKAAIYLGSDEVEAMAATIHSSQPLCFCRLNHLMTVRAEGMILTKMLLVESGRHANQTNQSINLRAILRKDAARKEYLPKKSQQDAWQTASSN